MDPSLDDFVRARVEEQVSQARGAMARGQGGSRAVDRGWAEVLTDAIDKQELLEMAWTADRVDRREYAIALRKHLAQSYARHPDFRPEWRL